MRQQHRRNGIRLAMFDYLQLIASTRQHDTREQEVSEVSRTFKTLARKLKIPVIVVAQLSRAVEGRTEKRPLLSDLRESGSIEQDADTLIFLFREDYYTQGRQADTHTAEWIIDRNRHGPTGFVRTHFAREYTWFSDFSSQ